MLGFSIFNTGIAVAKTCRPLYRVDSGIFGSCPVAVVAAVFSVLFKRPLSEDLPIPCSWIGVDCLPACYHGLLCFRLKCSVPKKVMPTSGLG